ncbi:hypothetical protein ElyMa_000031600 [Elysia marginata]|uniref:Uncharacterized protein n=1 Tax=Elysia marginata TaxID=1093978 RepID=A0AAV4ECU5_9GAST|nr:hypothetical protein ElyMa_000031600 [Elysia marginata]
MRGSSGSLLQLSQEGKIERKRGQGRPRRNWMDNFKEWFCRRLRLAEFFCDPENTETDNDADHSRTTLPDFLRKPSPFTPDSGRDIALDTYIKAVTTAIMTQRQKVVSPNLILDEKTALKELKTNTDIIIKPADKGGAVVVMNTTEYTTEFT